MSNPYRSLTRRRFLVGSSQVALAGGLGGLFPSVADARAPRVSDRAWRDLAQRLSGRLVRAQDAEYGELARSINLRYASVLPAGIARCQSAAEVAQAILWCRENRVPLVARSGGHSYAGYSTTSGLMIDLSLLNAVHVRQVDRHRTHWRRRPLFRHLRCAARVEHGHHPWSLLERRSGRLPAWRRHRLQRAPARPRLRSARGERDRHRRRPNQDAQRHGERRLVLGLPRRRRRQFRHPHLVLATDPPSRTDHRVCDLLDGEAGGGARRADAGARRSARSARLRAFRWRR